MAAINLLLTNIVTAEAMKSWIIVPLMAALALARINCPIYNCELNFANKESCYRQSYINGNISLQLHSCLDNKVCDIQQSSSDAEQGTCAKAYSAPISYPGEYCRNSSECYSTQCVNSTCVGLSKDSACVSDADCAAGLYCLSATCQPALKEGEACDATHRCMSNLVCDSGSCVLIGSRKVGTIASMPGACETMYVFNGKCAAGPTLKTSVGLTNSPEDGQCVYAFSEGKTITKEPTCGMTSKGKTFCNPGIGDVKIANVLSLLYCVST